MRLQHQHEPRLPQAETTSCQINRGWENLFKLFDNLVYNEFMKKFNLSNYVEVRSVLDIEKEIKSI